MTIARAVLLVGSAKPAGTSTSEALGRYLFARLEERRVATTVLLVGRSPASLAEQRLVAALADANLFVLATPVYVDSLPYPVTRALEDVSRSSPKWRAPCAFAALINCGFPELEQCHTALDIARAFAARAGFDWAGGLALGEGGAIDGGPLEQLGGLTRHVRAALDLTAAALAEGQPVPAGGYRAACASDDAGASVHARGEHRLETASGTESVFARRSMPGPSSSIRKGNRTPPKIRHSAGSSS